MLHQATVPLVPLYLKDTLASGFANRDGMLNILVVAGDDRVKIVVSSSTCLVYGDTTSLPESEKIKREIYSPYAVSMFTGVLFCQTFYKVFGLDNIVFRYFSVSSPIQNQKSHCTAVIPEFIIALLQCKPPTIFGEGKQSWGFIYVENIAEANPLTIRINRAFGEVFKIACSRQITITELVGFLYESIGITSELNPQYASLKLGSIVQFIS